MNINTQLWEWVGQIKRGAIAKPNEEGESANHNMSLNIGIVGLPNVGKSTLFQTITKKQVDCANYPFCTIDPNIGVVAVSDERVDKLAALTNSQKKIYTTVDFVDIAGLVKGAHKGDGLGNKFLANIRETDAIVYVLRAFLKEDVVTTQSIINPLDEKDTLDAELILKDLETLEKRLAGKEAIKEADVLKKAMELLGAGKVLSEQDVGSEEKKILSQYQLLTAKPRLYLLNGRDEEVPKEVTDAFEKNGWPYLIIDVLTEFEAAGMSGEERKTLGLKEELEFDLLIKKAYEVLGLITFFTTGPDETRAWTLKKGKKAPQAGGTIHSDFETHFIKTEAINWRNLMEAGGFVRARENGLIRTEGKDYVVQDGDVIEIKHSA